MSLADGPSDNLTWNELKCKDGTEYPSEWRTNRAFKLSRAFEDVRKYCGNKPIVVVSGYRTTTWNRKIGGAENSQHKQGRALDIKPPNGMTVTQLYDVVKLVAKEKGLIKGIGKYPNHIHIDVREGHRIAYWSGIAVRDSRTI